MLNTRLVLTFAEESTIHLPETYMWVVTKRFTVEDRTATSATILQALLDHPRYRDRYDQPEGVDQGNHGIHGPYIAALLTIHEFRSIDAESARRLLTHWCNHESLQTSPTTTVETAVLPQFSRAAEIWFLDAPARAEAGADHHVVDRITGWYEFVTIDRASGSIALVVASDD